MPPRQIDDPSGNGDKVNLDELEPRELLIVTAMQLESTRKWIASRFTVYDKAMADGFPRLAVVESKVAMLIAGTVAVGTIALTALLTVVLRAFGIL